MNTVGPTSQRSACSKRSRKFALSAHQCVLTHSRNSSARILPQVPQVDFTVRYNPYQLHPTLPAAGEDKYQWYLANMYNGNTDQMRKYTLVMSAHGVAEGLDFKFSGTIANTLNAHRVVQYFQEAKGTACADQLISCSSLTLQVVRQRRAHVMVALYASYFEKEQSPSSRSTLLAACSAAGISDQEAKAVVDDENEGLSEVKMLIREQAGNGVDAVPYIVLEGKRRDITLQGCKEVAEYAKALQQIIKESS